MTIRSVSCAYAFESRSFIAKSLILSISSFWFVSSAHALTVLGWSPGIDNNCYSEVWEQPNMHGNCVLNTSTGNYPRWEIGGTHEDLNFTGGTREDVRLADPVVDLDFYQIPSSGKFGVSMALDKINFPNYLDNQGRDIRLGHTAWLITESAQARSDQQATVFDLSEDVSIHVKVSLEQLEQAFFAPIGNAQVRIIMGVAVVWNNTGHYLEVNLMRTPGYDRCSGTDVSQPGNQNNYEAWAPLLEQYGWETITSPYPAGLGYSPVCDSSNQYDHRYVYLGGGTNRDTADPEIVYYNVENLPFNPAPALVPGGGFQTYQIPIGKLFRNYDWLRLPPYGSPTSADWSTVKSHGSTTISIYFGIEILGRGRAWVRFKDLQIWKPLD